MGGVQVKAMRGFRHRGRPVDAGQVLDVTREEAQSLVLHNRAVEVVDLPPCTRTSRRCPQGPDLTSVTPDCCRAHIREMLEWLAGAFAEAGITWWADYGTALGAVKCGGLYPMDKDGDLGVMQDDMEKVLALDGEATRAGFAFVFKPIRRTGPYGGGNSVKLRYSKTNHTNVDLFFWHEHDPRNECEHQGCQSRGRRFLGQRTIHRKTYVGVDRYKGKEVPVDRVFPLATVDYEGLSLPAPCGIREPGSKAAPHIEGYEAGSWFLEHRYGPGWHQDLAANHDGRAR